MLLPVPKSINCHIPPGHPYTKRALMTSYQMLLQSRGFNYTWPRRIRAKSNNRCGLSHSP